MWANGPKWLCFHSYVMGFPSRSPSYQITLLCPLLDVSSRTLCLGEGQECARAPRASQRAQGQPSPACSGTCNALVLPPSQYQNVVETNHQPATPRSSPATSLCTCHWTCRSLGHRSGRGTTSYFRNYRSPAATWIGPLHPASTAGSEPQAAAAHRPEHVLESETNSPPFFKYVHTAAARRQRYVYRCRPPAHPATSQPKGHLAKPG
jgi:hypothetical protein